MEKEGKPRRGGGTSEAGRVIASNAHAHSQQQASDARDKARQELAANRADTTTPLSTVGNVPLETLPEPPKLAPTRKFSISTEIAYRGRVLTVSAYDMTIDQFCDLMDARQYQAPAPLALAAPIATADDLPDGFKLCQKHRAPMRPRNKQNDTWHSHNVGTADKPCWCKGYRGSDSPGYEVD